VCADGAQSPTRRRLLPDVQSVYAGYVAWRGTLDETDAPKDLVRFFDDAFTFSEARSGGHILTYFIPGAGADTTLGRRRLNWVWYVAADQDELGRLLIDRDGRLHHASLQQGGVPQTAVRALVDRARTQLAGGRLVSRARTVVDALDAGWMQKEIERLENAVERDPALAIGTAKELVETWCKSILSKRGVEVSRKADLPELTKLLAKELKLVQESISDEAKGAETVRLILRNLSALTQYLAESRGLYGSGHGRDGKHRGLEPRHARLAVGAAVAFIDFVTETHHQRGESK
jgi:Abortive infection C-terminus